MTIDELYNQRSFLILLRSKCYSGVVYAEVNKGLEVIEREINLKTINPTTGKPNELHRNDV